MAGNAEAFVAGVVDQKDSAVLGPHDVALVQDA